MYAGKRAVLPVVATLLVVGLIVGFPTLATAQPGGPNWPRPFVGLWYSVDVDGSNQYMLIRPGHGGLYRVFYYDDMTMCEYPAVGYGEATADGYVLTAEVQVYCLADPPYYWLDWRSVFTYDPDTDTLVYDAGPPWGTLIWTRGHR